MSEEENNWRDSLPEELQGNEALASFEDVTGLAKSFIETKSMVGNSIRLPTENANDEQRAEAYEKILAKAPDLMRRPNFDDEDARNEFFKSLGRPDEANEYTAIEDFNEGLQESLRTAAHKAGLTTKQYESLLEDVVNHDKSGKTAFESARMEQLKELKGEWGMKYDENKAIADKVRDAFLDFIPEGQMDAQTIKALHNIGTQLLEGDAGFGDHRDDHESSTLTPADARAEISEIMNNTEHAYWNPFDPDHQAALDHMIELRKAADPEALDYLPRVGMGS